MSVDVAEGQLFTVEFVQDLFLYLSRLREPLGRIPVDSQEGLSWTPNAPAIDFSACHALMLVNRFFSRCWRLFEQHYVLLACEAIERGYSLYTHFDYCTRRLSSLADVEAGIWPTLSRKIRLHQPHLQQLGTKNPADLLFYSDERCILEAVRAQRLATLKWRVARAASIPASEDDTAVLPKPILARLPTSTYFEPEQHHCSVLPQRLFQFLRQHFDYKGPCFFLNNTGIRNVLLVLRYALTSPDPGLLHRDKTIITLPSIFFRRDPTNSTNTGLLMANSVEVLADKHPALLAEANEIFRSPSPDVARTMIFLLFRRLITCIFRPTLSWTHSSPMYRQRPMLSQSDTHGLFVGDENIFSAADYFLFGCTDFGAFATYKVNLVAYREKIQSRYEHRITSIVEQRWNRDVPSQLTYARETLTLIDYLQRTAALTDGASAPTDSGVALSLQLAFPDELGLLPKMAVAVDASQIQLYVLVDPLPGARPSFFIPLLSANAELRHSYVRIATLTTESPVQVQFTDTARCHFDVHCPDTPGLPEEAVYYETVISHMYAAHKSGRAHPQLCLGSIAHRLRFAIEYLIQLGEQDPAAATALLDNCTKIYTCCSRCKAFIGMHHSTAIPEPRLCHHCTERRKRTYSDRCWH